MSPTLRYVLRIYANITQYAIMARFKPPPAPRLSAIQGKIGRNGPSTKTEDGANTKTKSVSSNLRSSRRTTSRFQRLKHYLQDQDLECPSADTMDLPPEKLVEMTNELTLKGFLDLYQPFYALTVPRQAQKRAGNGNKQLYLSFDQPKTMRPADLEACFKLIETTSKDDYELGGGWNATFKRAEMSLPDLKYMLVKKEETGGAGSSKAMVIEEDASSVEGFMSFMITYEDGKEVVYCYEIHLGEELKGSGLGNHMMTVMEGIGRKVRVEKAMLSAFKTNEGALAFYERRGYGVDPYSPQPRVLRGGRVVEPTYLVLSKALQNPAVTSIRNNTPA